MAGQQVRNCNERVLLQGGRTAAKIVDGPGPSGRGEPRRGRGESVPPYPPPGGTRARPRPTVGVEKSATAASGCSSGAERWRKWPAGPGPAGRGERQPPSICGGEEAAAAIEADDPARGRSPPGRGGDGRFGRAQHDPPRTHEGPRGLRRKRFLFPLPGSSEPQERGVQDEASPGQLSREDRVRAHAARREPARPPRVGRPDAGLLTSSAA